VFSIVAFLTAYSAGRGLNAQGSTSAPGAASNSQAFTVIASML
jgi:hypothetical protein